MLGDRGSQERYADKFLPYLQHIAPQQVALDDGAVMGMVAVPGLPFELDANGVRNARPHQINALCQMISTTM